jgi:RecJ-like exonuclease
MKETLSMPDITCPKCSSKGQVVVKQSRQEKGGDLKYFECAKCHSIWTNTIDIANMPITA